MAWFKRGPEGGADDPSNFKAPSDEPKDKGRRNFMKVMGLGAGALAVESLVPKEVQAALDPQKKKETGGESNVERGQGKRVEIKGIQDKLTEERVRALVDSFLADPQIKFTGARPDRAVGGALTLEFGVVQQGAATMNEIKRQAKQDADNEIARSTGTMGNTANTNTIGGRAEQMGGRIVGAMIGGVLRNRNDKAFGNPEGDITVPIKAVVGRPRAEVAPYAVTVRYAVGRTGKISLHHVHEGKRDLPGPGPTTEKYTSGNQELYNEALIRAVEAVIADARTEGPVKSALALELMMYASAPKADQQRVESRAPAQAGSPQARGQQEGAPSGMVPMHGSRQPEAQRVPEAEEQKGAEKSAPRILPVNRRNN